jgi:NodT family efflux transporter outer membrane factor (OMF) lipoprotein
MKKSFIISLIFILLLKACKVGPNFEKPSVEMPSSYINTSAIEIKDALNIEEWWKFFNDDKLNEYIDFAIVNNYNLKIAFEKVIEARANYRIENSRLFPQINLDAQVIRERISQNLFTSPFQGPAIQNYYQIGFDSIWELDFFGKIRREKEAALYELFSLEDSQRDVYITLLSEVAKTYIDILSVNEKTTLFKKKIKNQNEIYLLTKDLFTSGIVSEQNELEEYSILKQLQEDLISLNTILNQSIYKLSTLLSINPESFIKDFKIEKITPIVKNIIKIDLPSTLLRKRPDIRKAENNLARSNAFVGSAIADLFPKISLTTTFNYSSVQQSKWLTWASRAWTIGPNLDLPIIDFGKRISNIKAKKSVFRQSLLNYKNIVILALEDVESSLVAYFNEMENLKLKEEKLDAVIQNTNLTENLFQAGIISQISYLKKYNLQIEIQNEFIDTKRNLNINLISLIKALGGGLKC